MEAFTTVDWIDIVHLQTDRAFSKLLNTFSKTPDIAFKNLHNLKLRQLALSEASVQPFLARCPNLKRLDISFTLVRRRPIGPYIIPPLEKISLTSLNMGTLDLLLVVVMLRNLRTLSVGALGTGQGSSVGLGNSSAMNMTDESLDRLIDVLKELENLEKVSIMGNSKLGLTDRAVLSKFIRRVGRRCKVMCPIQSFGQSDRR